MSSKGYIKIPEAQLRLERIKRVENRTWHNNIMNLLLGKNVCGACLRIEDDLVHWDAEFVVCGENDIESSLKNIMTSTFGPSITSIIPTTNFCQKCVDTILSAHLFILQLKENCTNTQRKLKEIAQQMKWTAYLDETGSLTECMLNNKLIQDDYDLISDNNGRDDLINVSAMPKEVKTHRIVLDNESLKYKLLQDSNMHKNLVKQVKLSEPKLPEDIIIKKVVKSVDITDFTPQDLLELDWADEEENTEPNPKLQSNEAVIMNLMEEAKTVEKHKHFHDNLNLQVNTPPQQQVLHDSLSVKLIQNEIPAQEDENDSDADDLVPQDLLELKWPDEPSNTQTKIPVKKLNFNEALTVKFIPAHKLVKVKDSADVPCELLEEDYLNKAGQKHSIDLTKWLHEQGMSTIKAQKLPVAENSMQDFDIEAHISKKVKLQMVNETEEPRNSGSGIKAIKCSITVKNLDVLKDTDDNGNEIRCGLCDLKFVLYESYWSHYKTHKISETAKCYRCCGRFPVVELLVEHLLLKHSEDMTYCTLCYALLNQRKLAKHMVDHHASKVEIINAASTMPLITKDGRCKKCNQSARNFPDTPHVCVFNFECTECKKDCIHQKYIKSYIEQIRDNKIIFKCTDCEFMYKTKYDIIKHANYMHLQHRSHQCMVCKVKFYTQNELAMHNRSSHFTCGRCKKVFPEKPMLYNHDCPKTDTSKCFMSCEACGQRFTSHNGYRKHKETALAVNDECILCPDSVLNTCNMSRHMQVKHLVYLKKENDIITYECTICQQNFDNGADFKRHSCLYECIICDRRFINKVLHERHMQAHSGIKNMKTIKPLKQQFQCNICNLLLLDKCAYTNHMEMHTNYAKCPICLTYMKRSELKYHIESHEGTTNSLKCPHCVLVCENHNQFEVHVNRFHLLRRPYQCDYCNKTFYGKQRLRDHIKEHFSQRRKVKCPICAKKFARKDTMKKHLELHSAGQLYNCDLCEKMYISASLLEQHRKCHTNDSELSQPQTSQSSQM